MLGIILIICLVVIVLACLVSNDWECLMCLWKNHMLFLSYRSIFFVVFSFDALFGLTWRMLTPCLTLTSRLKPLWSFGFWLVIPLYALVNNVLSLCMIMAVIALLVGRSQSFASLHLYWEGILLVHPTPKTKVFQRVHYKFLCMVFQTIPSKFSCATFQKPSNTSHFVTLFLAHEDIVVGFDIFHIELSTTQLACFICSSLILQESWSDHCNL
jgi:hypothetical protein